MSWSRRGVLLGGALALAACGFSPVYAPGGAGSKLFGQIRAADPKTPDEFTFAGRIAERLGPARDARFALAYKLAFGVALYQWVEGRFFGGPEAGLLDISFIKIIGNPGTAAGAADGAFPFLHV